MRKDYRIGYCVKCGKELPSNRSRYCNDKCKKEDYASYSEKSK